MFSGLFSTHLEDTSPYGYSNFPLNLYSNFAVQQNALFQFPILYAHPFPFLSSQFPMAQIKCPQEIFQNETQQRSLESAQIQKSIQKNISHRKEEMMNPDECNKSLSDYEQTPSQQDILNRKNDNKIRKKYKQNAQRNVLTNIGNQLMTFLGSRNRSEKVFFRAQPNASQEEISQFYGFIHKLRRRKKSPIYFNQKKLEQIWYPNNVALASSKNYQILRQMSLIFIQQILPLFMINSVRIKEETKGFHIAAIRKFLYLLRYRKMI